MCRSGFEVCSSRPKLACDFSSSSSSSCCSSPSSSASSPPAAVSLLSSSSSSGCVALRPSNGAKHYDGHQRNPAVAAPLPSPLRYASTRSSSSPPSLPLLLPLCGGAMKLQTWRICGMNAIASTSSAGMAVQTEYAATVSSSSSLAFSTSSVIPRAMLKTPARS
eukprot:scaffold149_cov315-Pinguiococcus_pyrenoidosus.AAC.156